MFRRDIFKAIGLGTFFGGTTSANVYAQSGQSPHHSTSELRAPTVGNIDLSKIRIMDTHVHQPAEMTYTQSNEFWNESFVNPLLPSQDFPGRAKLKTQLASRFKQHLDRLPREIGQRNYVARAYGNEASNEIVDQASARHINKDFPGYIRSVYERENIRKILLQSDSTNAERPSSLIPDDLFVWSYVINHMLQREWALAIGGNSIGDVLKSIDKTLEKLPGEGCVGLKVSIAYYRPLSLSPVDKVLADKSLSLILKNEPESYSSISENEEGEFAAFAVHPVYQSQDLQQAFYTYQDYLLRHIYRKAGELGLVVIVHSAVALHPLLQFDYNNPLALHHILRDEEIKRAQTKFLVIHAGYPYHDHVASLLSQFPNVYADVSFFANFPGTLEKILRSFLGLAPSEKIMYGSDTGLPESTGYCSFNVRQVLARIMGDYISHYGWTERDCETAIHNVLYRNAEQLFDRAT